MITFTQRHTDFDECCFEVDKKYDHLHTSGHAMTFDSTHHNEDVIS